MLDPKSTGKIQGMEPFFNGFLQWVPLVSLTGVGTALDRWSFAMASTSNHIYDAVVVGAGHNGLTAACYLARAGLSTLVLERRDIVGGCCVTEEIAPGCRASTTSYIASMLRPEVIRDLKLAAHGLRMVPCDPALQVPFPDGQLVSWWADRDRVVEELRKISTKDAETFVRVDDRLKKLARYLQPFFLEPPPEPDTKSLGGWSDLLRVGKRFRGISSADISQLVSFLTGSLGDFLDRNYESEKVKTLFLANNVYGKHCGPYQAGSAIGLLIVAAGLPVYALWTRTTSRKGTAIDASL